MQRGDRLGRSKAPSPHETGNTESAQSGNTSACGGRYSKLTLAVTLAAVVLWLSFAAQAQTKPAPAGKKPAASEPSPKEDPQLYRNTTFGFRYQIPYSWVDRTKQMKEGEKSGKAELLLAVFERPPEVAGDSVNSAVVIAAESVASYPGLKKAEEYLGPLTELVTAKGFKVDGEPYELEVESRQLLRADFVKTLDAGTNGAGTNGVGTNNVGTNNEKLSMHQCTLILMAKGQIVSFTFIASSDDALDDLMDGLHFGAVGQSPASTQSTPKPRP
jgi:hypothetical protein